MQFEGVLSRCGCGVVTRAKGGIRLLGRPLSRGRACVALPHSVFRPATTARLRENGENGSRYVLEK